MVADVQPPRVSLIAKVIMNRRPTLNLVYAPHYDTPFPLYRLVVPGRLMLDTTRLPRYSQARPPMASWRLLILMASNGELGMTHWMLSSPIPPTSIHPIINQDSSHYKGALVDAALDPCLVLML